MGLIIRNRKGWAACAVLVFGLVFGTYAADFRPTIFDGKIHGVKKFELYVSLMVNPVTQEEQRIEVEVDQAGNFSCELELSSVSLVKFYCGKQLMNLYLEPEMNLHIEASSQRLWTSAEFSGKGAANNRYLQEAHVRFNKYSDHNILEELRGKTSLEFRRFMDKLRSKKLEFLREFRSREDLAHNNSFVKLAEYQIEYWWVYQLLRYRTEYPASNNLPIPMELPISYYDFLLKIELSNEMALMLEEYRYMLDLFLDFVQEAPQTWQVLSSDEKELTVTNQSMLLIKNQSLLPVSYQLQIGQSLKALDKALLDKNTIEPDRFYLVETASKLSGWIQGENIRYIKTQVAEDNEKQRLKSILYMQPYVVGMFSSTEVRLEPYKQDVIDQLYGGEEAEYLLVRTSEQFEYTYFGSKYYDFWYKVRTPRGHEGWVFRGGVEMHEKRISMLIPKAIKKPSHESIINAYLNGTPRYYALAKKLANEAQSKSRFQLKQEVFHYLKDNPITLFDQTVRAAYQAAVKMAPQVMPKDESKAQENKKDDSVFSTKIKAQTNLDNPLHIDNLPCEDAMSRAIIEGKISNPTRKYITISLYLDPLIYQEYRREISLTADGSFFAEFEIEAPLIGTIKYADQAVDIYIRPNDNLELKFSGTNFIKTLKYNGIGANNNNYIVESHKRFTNFKTQLKTKIQYAKPTEFVIFVRSVEYKKLEYLEQSQKKSPLSNDFYPIALANINFWRASQLLNYPYEHPLYHGKDAPMQLNKAYYAFLDEVDLNAPTPLLSQQYLYFLQQYLDYIQTQSPKNIDISTIAQQHLNQESYYYTAAKELSNTCRIGQLQQAGPAIQQFISECPDNTLSNALRFVYNEAKSLTPGQKAPDFQLTDIDGNSVSLSNYIGKIVYVDFWATWCAPCRSLITYSQQLAKKFDPDQVAFLYISLDDKKTDWEQYVKNNNLSGTHLCAKTGHGYHSKIAELYKVKSLPAYFIIDQNGHIAQAPALSPSNPELVQQINDLLHSR